MPKSKKADSSGGHDSKPTSRDIAVAVAKGMLGAVPYVGSVAAEMVSLFVTTPLDKRRSRWIESLAASLDGLRRGEGVDWESLATNESFISTVFHATQVAMRSHQEEKLHALRNAVLSAARPGAPDDDLQLMFLGLVDSFTPWHLRLAKYLDDPALWCKRHEVSYGNLMAGAVSSVLELAFPELKGRRDFYDQLAKDLFANGLTNTEGLHTMVTADAMVAPRTTEMGKSFLRFITGPPDAESAPRA
jgi:hypothetical protein